MGRCLCLPREGLRRLASRERFWQAEPWWRLFQPWAVRSVLKADAEPQAGVGLPALTWREVRPEREGLAEAPWERSPQGLQETERVPQAEEASRVKRRPWGPEAAAERTGAEPERWPCGARVASRWMSPD